MSARSAVRRGLVRWLALSLGGCAIVALPDRGPRVFDLSERHGPSAWDLVGVTILLVGWACLLVPLLRARSLIPVPGLFLGAVLVGLVIVAWSVAGDVGAWWVVGALMAAGAQVGAAVVVGRIDEIGLGSSDA